jgi:hypothetical protein
MITYVLRVEHRRNQIMKERRMEREPTRAGATGAIAAAAAATTTTAAAAITTV